MVRPRSTWILMHYSRKLIKLVDLGWSVDQSKRPRLISWSVQVDLVDQSKRPRLISWSNKVDQLISPNDRGWSALIRPLISWSVERPRLIRRVDQQRPRLIRRVDQQRPRLIPEKTLIWQLRAGPVGLMWSRGRTTVVSHLSHAPT